jgi:hypothetical protein
MILVKINLFQFVCPHPHVLHQSDIFFVKMIGITGHISIGLVSDYLRMIVGQLVPYTLPLTCGT